MNYELPFVYLFHIVNDYVDLLTNIYIFQVITSSNRDLSAILLKKGEFRPGLSILARLTFASEPSPAKKKATNRVTKDQSAYAGLTYQKIESRDIHVHCDKRILRNCHYPSI